MPRKKRESDVHVSEAVALDQSANPDRRRVAQAGRVQAEAVSLIAVDRSSVDVLARVGQAPHSLVADIPKERVLVQQFENEAGVAELELAQHQASRFDDDRAQSGRVARPRAIGAAHRRSSLNAANSDAISWESAPAAAERPFTTPSLLAVGWFWLIFHLPVNAVIENSKPTIRDSIFST